jgi:hypothetical protein
LQKDREKIEQEEEEKKQGSDEEYYSVKPKKKTLTSKGKGLKSTVEKSKLESKHRNSFSGKVKKQQDLVKSSADKRRFSTKKKSSLDDDTSPINTAQPYKSTTPIGVQGSAATFSGQARMALKR